ncbi:ABC transporter permease [Sulfobacillus harzensis]|uniref:ABC transporter permease n=1 Tax=Sulfobacillus harzensis TaxID=2729629 RepID=A0A7Y0L2U8_9FIRM|nr:ABC transporter permease [Sulfobacillus harzensis]NMP22266.1 ABC transporter permease [Sulfobacillus harzensis]
MITTPTATTPNTVPGGRMKRFRQFLSDPKAAVGIGIVVLFVLIAIFAPVLTHVSPTDQNFTPSQPPSLHHLFGTTDQGQDVFSQFVWGTRASLVTGALAGGFATILAMLIGMLSGYIGGWVDEALQLLVNVFLVIPGLPLMIVLAAYITLGGNLPIIIVVAVTGWAWGARVLRSQVLAMRSLQFVEAADMAGQSKFRIVFQEILPNMTSLVFANFLFTVVYAILSAASLEFLGLGNLNQVSWGSMLYWSNNDGAILTGSWWWFVPPGLAIAILGAGLALLNYSIDESTNPRLRAFRVGRLVKKQGKNLQTGGKGVSL